MTRTAAPVPAAPVPDPAPPARRGAAPAVAAAVAALARAARSLVLYEAHNAAVHQLLREYGLRMGAALEQHGPLVLELRPFQIAHGGEVVYEEVDREKSLAFKLFRDGARRLTIAADAAPDDLFALVEILAVRCSGVRQAEDDAVTLLRKAELRGIAVQAVDGFTPAEESPEPELEPDATVRARPQPPASWDTPPPALSGKVPLAWRPVPDGVLAPLRAEDGDAATVPLALSLARDLLAEASRAGWPVPDPDLLAFVSEVRDGLLADGQLAALRQLLDAIGAGGGAELRDELLRGLSDARTLDAVLASVPADAPDLPPELVPLLPLLGIEAALDRIAAPEGEVSEGRRQLLVKVVVARLPREADAVLARLATIDPRLARELVRAVVARAPERRAEVARQLLRQCDEGLRLEGLAALEAAPGALPIRLVCELLGDGCERIRVRAAELLARRGDASAAAALRSALEEVREPAQREGEALARALAAVAPSQAGPLFEEWLAPRARFLRGLSPEQQIRQWAAVAGTGALPGARAEQVLQELAQRSDDDLRLHALATLARRRKEAGHVPPGG